MVRAVIHRTARNSAAGRGELKAVSGSVGGAGGSVGDGEDGGGGQADQAPAHPGRPADHLALVEPRQALRALEILLSTV